MIERVLEVLPMSRLRKAQVMLLNMFRHNCINSWRVGGEIELRFDQNCSNSTSRAICAGLVIAVHASTLVLYFIAAPVARVPRADVTTAFSLPGLTKAANSAPKITAVRPRAPARAMLAMARRAVIAPASIPATLVPFIGPIAVAEILELAGSPLAVTSASAAAEPIGGACDLTDPVQSALQANPDVRARLPMIPADQRSVANAIMVWNAGWLHSDDAAAKNAYAAIRDVVAGAVMAASDACRSQIQSGPRLVFLHGVILPGDRGQTTVLALGSGQWTWQQVADTAFTPADRPMTGSARFTAANTPLAPPASLKTGEE